MALQRERDQRQRAQETFEALGPQADPRMPLPPTAVIMIILLQILTITFLQRAEERAIKDAYTRCEWEQRAAARVATAHGARH